MDVNRMVSTARSPEDKPEKEDFEMTVKLKLRDGVKFKAEVESGESLGDRIRNFVQKLRNIRKSRE
ncbi:MAG: hypothetical protein ACFFD4_34845 [Candidatus Odinarchaeota archaeon]